MTFSLKSIYIGIGILGGAVLICMFLVMLHVIKAKCQSFFKRRSQTHEINRESSVYIVNGITEPNSTELYNTETNYDAAWNRSRPFSKITLGNVNLTGVTTTESDTTANMGHLNQTLEMTHESSFDQTPTNADQITSLDQTSLDLSSIPADSITTISDLNLSSQELNIDNLNNISEYDEQFIRYLAKTLA